MPNIRAQSISADGTVTIVATDGRQWSVTPVAILGTFALQTGSRTAKRSATINLVRAEIHTMLGAEQVPSSSVTVDFDDATGHITRLEVAS